MPIRLLLSVLLALLLPACGFHLRGSLPASGAAKSIVIQGISRNHPFYQNFSQVLSYSGGWLVDKPEQASVVIQISRARHERRPITLSKQGLANTFDLSFLVQYEVLSPKGEKLLKQQELEVRRDYFNDQSAPLGQAEEEGQMRLEMEREAAQALFRRVVSVLGHSTGS